MKPWLTWVLAMALSWWWMGAGRAADLAPGDEAPDFRLLDQRGERHDKQAYEGRWLVLYFYPKDDTPGCTAEACALRDDLPAFARMGVALLGVSTDDVESHEAFARKYHLPFPLLADTDAAVVRAYGALFELGPIRFAKRQTFVLDPRGKIARVYRDVNAKSHSAELIEDLRELLAPAR